MSEVELDVADAKAGIAAAMQRLRETYNRKGRVAMNDTIRQWWVDKTARSLGSQGATIGKTWKPLTEAYAQWKKIKGLPTGVWVLTGQTRTALSGSRLRTLGSRWKWSMMLPPYPKFNTDNRHGTDNPFYIVNWLRPIQTKVISKTAIADLDARLQALVDEFDAAAAPLPSPAEYGDAGL